MSTDFVAANTDWLVGPTEPGDDEPLNVVADEEGEEDEEEEDACAHLAPLDRLVYSRMHVRDAIYYWWGRKKENLVPNPCLAVNYVRKDGSRGPWECGMQNDPDNRYIEVKTAYEYALNMDISYIRCPFWLVF